MITTRSLAITAAFCAALTGCQTTGEGAAETSPTPLTIDQVVTHVAGNTEFWDRGGGYYSPDGVFLVRWDGKDGIGTWEATGNSEICHVVDLWNNVRDCHSYADVNGTITITYNGKSQVAEIRAGNHLHAM